ncbi:MAG TPA: hypothetical protein VN086_01200, partial [Candidatus Paceibacterota bacterium]|nr:hypothetical protein [Candidatus Paceibacterota bacterium]
IDVYPGQRMVWAPSKRMERRERYLVSNNFDESGYTPDTAGSGARYAERSAWKSPAALGFAAFMVVLLLIGAFLVWQAHPDMFKKAPPPEKPVAAIIPKYAPAPTPTPSPTPTTAAKAKADKPKHTKK